MNEDIKRGQFSAIYARVSSERQKEEGTIASQIAEVEKAITANGDIYVKKYIDDGYSGELFERPGLDQLRTEAKKKLFSKVYVLSPDRLARKHHYAAIIMEDLSRSGVDMIFVNRPIGDTIEDKLLFNVQSIIAEYEKAKILDRLRRGKLFKIKQGNILGNTPPYGYSYVKDEKSRHGWYEVNETEAQTVRLIFRCYTSNECSGLGGLRRELYRLNIKNRGGTNKWSQSMVARVVSNETYIGTTYWGKFKSVEGESRKGYRRLLNTKRIRRPKEEWLPISVPAIIDESQFRKAELKRATNKSLSPNKVKNYYLLRGLMEHSCGAPIYSKLCHGRKYYICSSRKNSFIEKSKCPGSRHYNGDDLESLVWNEFLKIVQSPAMLKQRISQRKNNSDSEKTTIESRIKDIDNSIAREVDKRNRLVVAYSESAITLEELKIQRDEIQKAIDSKISEKERLFSSLNTKFEEIPRTINLESFSAKIKSLLKDIDVSMKQAILRYFINRIVLDGDTANIKAVLPREILVAPTLTLSLLHEHRYDNGYPMEIAVKIPLRRIGRKSLSKT
ncbi:MAG: recombinase family protein [Ignavibacteriaceae bacterium]